MCLALGKIGKEQSLEVKLYDVTKESMMGFLILVGAFNGYTHMTSHLAYSFRGKCYVAYHIGHMTPLT